MLVGPPHNQALRSLLRHVGQVGSRASFKPARFIKSNQSVAPHTLTWCHNPRFDCFSANLVV